MKPGLVTMSVTGQVDGTPEEPAVGTVTWSA